MGKSDQHSTAAKCEPWSYFGDVALQRRHNGSDGVSNHQPHDCLLNRLFRRRSKKTSKLRVTDLSAGNSPGTREFPAQMASNAENASILWRHHDVKTARRTKWVKDPNQGWFRVMFSLYFAEQLCCLLCKAMVSLVYQLWSIDLNPVIQGRANSCLIFH